MTAMIKKYDIARFNDIMYEGFDYQLDASVVSLIQNLAEQVGAPEYVKTPQFSRRERPNYGNKKRYKNNAIIDEDWEAIRQFQTTELKKKEGIDAIMDTIRKHLNKITDKTYESLSNKIFEELSNIPNHDNPSEELLEEFKKIGEAIFKIASSNLFYSQLYARLYHDLMDKYTFMAQIFKDNFIKYGDVFKNIEYCSPEENYDRFCEINKLNETRRSLGAFYVNLMKLEVVDKEAIIKIIQEVQSYMISLIYKENNKPIIDELSEVLFILVTNSYTVLENTEEWEQIIDNIRLIAGLKVNDRPSLTNKTIFKHMDILDEFN